MLALCAFRPDSLLVDAFITAIGTFIPVGCCIVDGRQDTKSSKQGPLDSARTALVDLNGSV